LLGSVINPLSLIADGLSGCVRLLAKRALKL
jgi:hypothetical protein